MSIRVLHGDCRDVLCTLPDESVHCIVTSPPYFGLRDYGVAGQIGLEQTPDAYVAELVGVFRECRRVLRSDGVAWINLGDSFGQRKQLQGIPWKVAFALQADGWILRCDVIWSKPNPMPESVTDRPTKAHEYLFLLSKSERYFYDAEAVREEIKPASGLNMRAPKYDGGRGDKIRDAYGDVTSKTYEEVKGANRRSVWTVATQPFSEAHFATFPPDLIEPCIKAGTSEKGCCAKCGAPWKRVVSGGKYEPPLVEDGVRAVDASRGDKTRKLDGKSKEWRDASASRTTTGWSPSCSCNAAVVPCTVLDPFGGAGTTALVADRFQRNSIIIELNPDYVAMTQKRLAADGGMFTEIEAA